VMTTMIHEFIHVVMNDMALTGMINPSWLGDFPAVHAGIHEPLHLNPSCGTDGSTCGESCGIGEGLARRFVECVEGTRNTDLREVRCAYQIDYCDDRINGNVGGFDLGDGCHGSPSVSIDSECFAVSCDDSGSVSSACCGAMSGGALPTGVFLHSPDPGPRPPSPSMWFPSDLPWAI